MKFLFIGLMAAISMWPFNMSVFAQTRGEGWRLYYIDEPYRFYYDKGSIESPQKKIIKVWIKVTEKMRGDDELEQNKIRFQIDCSKKTYEALSRITYDTAKGGVLNSEDYMENPQKGSVWKDSKTNSQMNSLIENACP